MGILDDAIREHLDLKRRQGADQDELQRLEDEAFGPPTRPGGPEAERPEGEQAPADERGAATEAPALVDQSAEQEADSLEFDEELEISASAGPSEAETDLAEADAQIPAGEPTVEHDTLAEGESEEIDLDIELQIDEEIEDVGGLDLEEGEVEASEVAGEQEGGADEPIESLETVEHHFDDALDEADVVEGDALGDEGDEEDVLEETPEFLRDAPEDDELWFEQGEPKDFDF